MTWHGQRRDVACGAQRCTPAGRGRPAQCGGLAMEMTRQYLAGELSVLLGHLQAAATTEKSSREAWSLRQAVENEPVRALGSVTVRALALTEGLCWDSLNRGDAEAFTRQAAVCTELHEFGVCASLIEDDWAGLPCVAGSYLPVKGQGDDRRQGPAGGCGAGS